MKKIPRKKEPAYIRGTCVICGTAPQKPKGTKDKQGRPQYKAMCQHCHRQRYEKPYTIYKEDKCSRCGFIPEHRCQLDVDHIDGNHSNNEPSNLQTLCANCHRLKTYLHGDTTLVK